LLVVNGQCQHVLCIVLFLYLEGKGVGVTRELTVKENTVHSGQSQGPQTLDTYPQLGFGSLD
jgi:hypothetical protein